MRDINEAIRKGLEIVKTEDDLDLDVVDVMAFYDMFLERDKSLPLFDAVTRTAYDAFLAGIAFGKSDIQKKKN